MQLSTIIQNNCLKNNPVETGIVTLEDLPECNWIYLDKEGLIRNFVDELISHFSFTGYGCIKKLSDLVRIKQGTLQKFHRQNRKKLRIMYFKQLLSFLPKDKQQIVLDRIQKHIVKIGFRRASIINPKLPINFASINGAEFLGDLLTDGSLNSNLQVTYSNTNFYRLIKNLQCVHLLLTGEPIILTKKERCMFNSKDDQKLLYLIKELIKKSKIRCSFYISEKIDEYKKRVVYQLTYTPVLGKILKKGLNIPKGRRVYTNPFIPKFILVSKKCSVAFIGRIFSNEGHVESFGTTICHSIDLTDILVKNLFNNKKEIKQFLEEQKEKFAPKLLWDYKKIFYLLGCIKPSDPYVAGIYFTKSKKLRVKFNIYLGGNDVKRLYHLVEFDADFKERLEKYFDSVKYFRVQKLLLAKDILTISKDIENEYGYFTIPKINFRLNLERSTIQKHIKNALSKGLLKVEGRDGHALIYKGVKNV